MKKKKTFWIIGGIFLLLIIAAANSPSPEKIGEHSYASNQPSEAQVKIFQQGDQVKLENDVLVVNDSFDCQPSNAFLKPDAGMRYFVVDVTQENQGSVNPRPYNVLYFKLQDSADFIYNSSFSDCKEPGFESGEIQDEQRVRGFITFEIPVDSTPTQLLFEPLWIGNGQIAIQLGKSPEFEAETSQN